MDFASNYVYIPKQKGPPVGVRSVGPIQSDAPALLSTAPPLTTVPEEPTLEESDSEQPKPKPLQLQERLLIPAETSTPRQNAQDKKKLSVKSLVNETKEVVDWHGVGLQLDIAPADLNRIHADYTSEDKRKAKMYEFWLDNDPNASWEKLSGSLQNVAGHYCLSRRIQREYVEPEEPKSGRGPQSTDHAAPEHEIDTNVLAIKFKILGEPKPLHTGDAVFCMNEKCGAVLNSFSVITEKNKGNDKVWACEFCGTENAVDVVNEEIPLKDDVQFIISPGPALSGAKGAYYNEPAGRNALVVFCVDTSGSMGVTSEVMGRFELKGHDRLDKLHRQYSQGENQFMPGQRRDVTYVSRMQSVQGAIDHQLSTLAKTSPSQKVALVTFNNEVTIAGDGKLDEVIVSGDKLFNYDALVKLGEDLAPPSPITKNREYLSKKVMDLEESGQTALGPALLLSILLASHAPGSKVIICTDGLANTGIGSLDNITTHEKLQVAEEYYSKLGTMARDKSVSVSVLTIKGTETRLLELGRVADISKGKVTVVDPAKVKDEFTSILATPVVATEVQAKVVLHYDLCIRGSEESLIKIPVGNVTTTTELTYEFEPRKKKTAAKEEAKEQQPITAKDGASIAAVQSRAPPPVKIAGKSYLPFQLQLEFTAPDKSRYLRVVTKTKPFTDDLEEAEQSLQMRLLGLHLNRATCGRTLDCDLDSEMYAEGCMKFVDRQRHRGLEGTEETMARLEQAHMRISGIKFESGMNRPPLSGSSRQVAKWKRAIPDEIACETQCAMNEDWPTLVAAANTHGKEAGKDDILPVSVQTSSTMADSRSDTAAATPRDEEPMVSNSDHGENNEDGNEKRKSWFQKLWNGTSS